MNFRLFLLGTLASIIFLNSCNDDLKNLGMTTKPEGDGNSTQADTFYVELATREFEGGVYARTTYGLLGEMYDPLYGNIKADYLCQFYCEEGFTFNHEPIDAKIDSIKLNLHYYSWAGDSIAPMTAEIYKVSTPLERNLYSEFDPTKYYNPSDLIAQKTYTPRDYSSSWSASSKHAVSIPLPLQYGQQLYEDTKNNPQYFKNQDAFNEYFKGLYITTSENSKGNFIDVSETEIALYYKRTFTVTSTSTGKDSTYIGRDSVRFRSSPELIQMNRFENSRQEKLLADTEHSYVKSPGGVYTTVKIPTASANLIDKIEDRTINNLFFSLWISPPEEHEYAFTAPEFLLLLPKDSIKTHFEKNRLPSSSTLSYFVQYKGYQVDSYGNVDGRRLYDFGNIANVVQKQMEIDPNNDIELAIVPINATVTRNTYGQITEVTAVEPLLLPYGAQFRKDKELLKFYITSSKFKE